MLNTFTVRFDSDPTAHCSRYAWRVDTFSGIEILHLTSSEDSGLHLIFKFLFTHSVLSLNTNNMPVEEPGEFTSSIKLKEQLRSS